MKRKESLPIYKRETVNKIVISVILDNRRPIINVDDKKGVYYPVKIRVTQERKANYLTFGKMFTMERWFDICNEGCKKAFIKDAVRPELNIFVDKAVTITKELTDRKCFSFDKLKDSFNCVSVKVDDDNNVCTLIDKKITELKENNKYNTATTYSSTLKALKEFRGETIAIGAIDIKWLQRFEKYLLDNNRNNTTIGIYMRNIRHILKTCIPDKLSEESFPFGQDKYQIPTGASRDMALTKEQLRMIRDYDDGLAATRQYRDLWLFSFYANGANMADILRFKFDNIINGEIQFYRHKTAERTKEKKPIYVTIDDDMIDIINRWGNKRKKGAYIFPYLNGLADEQAIVKRVADVTRRVNRRISNIGKSLNLDDISTYTARHSFASVMMWEGSSVGYISQSLGHANISTTAAYLEQFQPDKRREEHNKVKL